MAEHREPTLLPCPFCGGAMQYRAALWPSEGDVDGIIHAEPTACPLGQFENATFDESIIEEWNRRILRPSAAPSQQQMPTFDGVKTQVIRELSPLREALASYKSPASQPRQQDMVADGIALGMVHAEPGQPSNPAVARFTPGPWAVEHTNEWDESEISHPVGDDREDWPSIAMAYGGLGTASVANARLICAAPDMHAALDHVEAVLSIVRPRSNTKEYLEALHQVRAALTKASPLTGLVSDRIANNTDAITEKTAAPSPSGDRK